MSKGIMGVRRCLCEGNLAFGIHATAREIEGPTQPAWIDTVAAIKVGPVRAPMMVRRNNVSRGEIPPDSNSWNVGLLGGPISQYDDGYDAGETNLVFYSTAKVHHDTNGKSYVTYIGSASTITPSLDVVNCIEIEGQNAIYEKEIPLVLRARFNVTTSGYAGDVTAAGPDLRYLGCNREGFVSVGTSVGGMRIVSRFRYSDSDWQIGTTDIVVPSAIVDDTPFADFEGDLNSGLPSGLFFSEGGTAEGNGWSLDGHDPFEGSSCIRTNSRVDIAGSSDLSIRVNVKTAGNITFKWKFDNRLFPAETPPTVDDKLQFWVDGTKEQEWDNSDWATSGTLFDEWFSHSHFLTVGIHTIRWTMERATENNDLVAYLDAIQFPELGIEDLGEDYALIKLPAQMSDGGDFWVLAFTYLDDDGNIFADKIFTGKWTNELSHNKNTDTSPSPGFSVGFHGLRAVLTPAEQINALHTKTGWALEGEQVTGFEERAYTRLNGLDYVLIRQVNEFSGSRTIYFDGLRDEWFTCFGAARNIYPFDNGDIVLACENYVEYLNADGTSRWIINAEDYLGEGNVTKTGSPNLSGNKDWIQIKNFELIRGEFSSGTEFDDQGIPDPAYDASTIYIASGPAADPDDPNPVDPRPWIHHGRTECAISVSRELNNFTGQPTIVIHRQLDYRFYRTDGSDGADDEDRPFPVTHDPLTAALRTNMYTSITLLEDRFNNLLIPESAMSGYPGFERIGSANVGFDCVPSCKCGCAISSTLGY